MASKPVICSACGQEWSRDPALEVVCPDCKAGVGVRCRRPSGHPCDFHVSRFALTHRLGYESKCPGAKVPHRRPEQQGLFR